MVAMDHTAGRLAHITKNDNFMRNVFEESFLDLSGGGTTGVKGSC